MRTMLHERQPSGRTRCFDVQRFCKRFLLSCFASFVFAAINYCQVDTATISGMITDQSRAVVAGVEVRLINTDRNISAVGTSNQSGVYVVTSLRPGRYRIKVEKEGFKAIDLTDLILNVQDSVSRNFTLQVGSTSESVSVEGNALQINTQDASVGTVVDPKFVENVPLNGRSFQSLILLTPGVTTTNPQAGASSIGVKGELSVNGQRTEANYYTVDGVSANVGIAVAGNPATPGVAGSLPTSSALGTTQGLASVDALEEFRVQTS